MVVMKSICKLSDLTPDDKNLNKHTERGTGMAERSLQECGAGRSIVVDKNGKIIGGNQIAETCAAIGMENVHVVQSDGTKLVVVQRTDLDLDSKNKETRRRSQRLAILDNRSQISTQQRSPLNSRRGSLRFIARRATSCLTRL